MCFPMAIPLALMAAGSIAQFAGQSQSDHAMTRTFNREETRQKAFQGQENQAFQDSLNSANNITDPNAQAAAAAKRNAAFTAVTKSAGPGPAGAYLPGSVGSNPIVNTAAQAAGKVADAHTASLGQALANLGGMGDVMQNANIAIGRNAQTIDQAAGMARGSRDVLQTELDAARRKGSTLKMLGGLAQSLGGMMAGGGFGGSAGGSIVNAGSMAGAGTPMIGSPTGGFGGLLPLLH